MGDAKSTLPLKPTAPEPCPGQRRRRRGLRVAPHSRVAVPLVMQGSEAQDHGPKRSAQFEVVLPTSLNYMKVVAPP